MSVSNNFNESSRILKQNISHLENNNCFKLICGASLTDTDKIFSLSFLYSLAGVSIIDISPEIECVLSAKEGIKRAKGLYKNNPDKYKSFNEPILMISLNVFEDPHFKTAYIDNQKCTLCLQCIDYCPFKAIENKSNSVLMDSSLCYGCGKCIPGCSSGAISLIENHFDLDSFFAKLNIDDIQGIELHIGNSSNENIDFMVNKLINILGYDYINNLLISYSLESTRYNNLDLVGIANYLSGIFPNKSVIQVDGTPMSGNAHPSSSLQSLCSALTLLKNNVNAYIIPSGGINNYTYRLIRDLEINCSGLAMGTFARKLVWPYLDNLSELSNFDKAIGLTKNIVGRLEI